MTMKYQSKSLIIGELEEMMNVAMEYVKSSEYDEYVYCWNSFEDEDITEVELKALEENIAVRKFNKHIRAFIILCDFNGSLTRIYKKYLKHFGIRTFTTESNIRFCSKINLVSNLMSEFNFDLNDSYWDKEMNSFVSNYRSRMAMSELLAIEKLNNMYNVIYKHADICSLKSDDGSSSNA
ncbi:P21 [Common oak ringspot-associated virus]|uniref:P21 n=1 Tax=Common oak ringspot-associated virus TaxID=2742449 RepID=A0A7G2A2Q8_9VIRU|nr:P21 [Common oak ringspot-associated virus]CAD0281689.1 P21 [Common oak ringspot-associated virus]